MAQVQSVDDKALFLFVGYVNAHHSGWLKSVYPTNGYECDAHNFYNLSGCQLLVHCPTHIAGNRLYLVMTDVLDIVDDVRWYSTGNF